VASLKNTSPCCAAAGAVGLRHISTKMVSQHLILFVLTNKLVITDVVEQIQEVQRQHSAPKADVAKEDQ
jgi:hypothetical protein